MNGFINLLQNKAMINRLARQFLVHSFLYYQLDETLIDDNEYDKICKKLNLHRKESNEYVYKDIIEKALGIEASGYTIHKYPPEIISTALHLLYQTKYKDTKTLNMFCKSYGYNIE